MRTRLVPGLLLVPLLVAACSHRSPAPSRAPLLREALRAEVPPIRFGEAPVGDILDFLHRVAGLSQVIRDPGVVGKRVDLATGEATAAEVLAALAGKLGVAQGVVRGAVFLGPPERLAALRALPPIAYGKGAPGLGFTLAIEYHDCDMALISVAESFTAHTGIPVAVDPRVVEHGQGEYGIHLGPMAAADFLWWVGVLWEVQVAADRDGVRFAPRPG